MQPLPNHNVPTTNFAHQEDESFDPFLCSARIMVRPRCAAQASDGLLASNDRGSRSQTHAGRIARRTSRVAGNTFGFFRVAPRRFLLYFTGHDARRPFRRQKLTQKNPNGMRTIPCKSQYKSNVSDSCPVWRSIILLKEEDQPEKKQIRKFARPRRQRRIL